MSKTPEIHHSHDAVPGLLNVRFARYLEREQPSYQARRRTTLVFAALVVAAALTGLSAAYAVTAHVMAAWAGAGIGVAGGAWAIRTLIRLGEERRRAERTRRVVQHGVPVTGYLVRAAESLSRPGPDDQPCQVLISFQPEVAGDDGYMRWLARRVREMRDDTPRDPDGRYVAALTADERRPILHQRRKLPLSFTDGSTVFCADLLVRRAYLKGGCLSSPRLPCLAETGDTGGIELIPAWLIADNAAEPAGAADKRPV
jgi:hypothetical protein